jgi:ribose transport system permease protein
VREFEKTREPAERPGAPAESGRVRLTSIVLRLLKLGPLLILVLLIIVLSNLSPVFFTPGNLGNVLIQCAAISILAMGQLLVILTRGIDLSVGSNVALSAVVGALVFGATASGSLSIIAMLLTGAAVGAANGFGYVFGKLPHPFIITLATLSIARGLALGLSGGRRSLACQRKSRPLAGERQRGSLRGFRTLPSLSLVLRSS